MTQVPQVTCAESGHLLQALLRQDLGAFAERCFYEVAGGKKYLHN